MFPYTCDALLFHLPIATGVLMAVNILTFIGGMTGTIDVENGWQLEYGTGLHPVEWLLSPFMHADFGHLLGDLFFLWSFGLITEGKLGWRLFLLVYLGIAVGQCALEQSIMPLFAPDVEFSLGASAAIYGLMGMACVWAPINELSVFMLLTLRPIVFQIGVGVFALMYVGIDLLFCAFLGAGAVGSVTHLMGGAMGLVAGIVLLKSGVVDCNDYDLFSVLSGEYGSDKEKKREKAEAAAGEVTAAERLDSKSLEARRKFDAYLQINQPEQALAVKLRAAQMGRPLDVNREDLLRLITGLHQQKRWVESAPLMAEVLTNYPANSQAVRLKLAQICLVEMEKPHRALDLLTGLEGARLAPAQEALRTKIRAVAQRQVDAGTVEIDDEAW